MSGGNTLAKKFGTGGRGRSNGGGHGKVGPSKMFGARGAVDQATFDKGTTKRGRPQDGIPSARTARRYGQS